MNPSQPADPVEERPDEPILGPWERGGPDAKVEPAPEPDPEEPRTEEGPPETGSPETGASVVEPWGPVDSQDADPDARADEEGRRPDGMSEVDPNAMRLWGTEYTKLSGPGWRRLQQLEPAAPSLPEDDDDDEELLDAEAAAQGVGHALRSIRESTDERLGALEGIIEQLAQSVEQSMWSSSSTEIRRELTELREAIAARTAVFERTVPAPTPAGEEPEDAAETTKSTISDAVTWLSDQMVRSTSEQARQTERVLAETMEQMRREIAAEVASRTERIEATFSERVIRLAEALQADAAAQTQRTRAAISEAVTSALAGRSSTSAAQPGQFKDLSDGLATLGEQVAAVSRQVDARAAGVQRLLGQAETSSRTLAEIRASLPSSDALGELVQSEIQGLRAEVAALREGSSTDLDRRLDAMNAQLTEVASALRAVSARVEDMPPASSLTEILQGESERSRVELREMGESIRSLVADLRMRADRLESDLSEVAARLEGSRQDPDRLISALQAEAEETRRELVRAADATDQRARTIIASMAREVLSVADGQRELRDELRRLAARIVGRPVI